MARHEPDIRPAEDTPLTLTELLNLLGEQKEQVDRARQDAIACYLSASEGWDEAVQRLGGTFAGDVTGLKGRKGD